MHVSVYEFRLSTVLPGRRLSKLLLEQQRPQEAPQTSGQAPETSTEESMEDDDTTPFIDPDSLQEWSRVVERLADQDPEGSFVCRAPCSAEQVRRLPHSSQLKKNTGAHFFVGILVRVGLSSLRVCHLCVHP
jgi:hypothetical protein